MRPWLLALGAGAALWTITAVAGGRVEPWDASAYWTVSYPIALALSAVFGYLHPDRPWRWAVALIFVQLPVMLAGGAGFGLLPLGMALLGVLCLPAVLVARVAARSRLRRDAR